MGQKINMQNYMGVSYSNECKFVAKCITNTDELVPSDAI